MGMSKQEAGMLGYLKSKEAFQAKVEQQKKEAREKYEQNKKNCKDCNNPITYENRVKDFCNSSCSARFNNRKRRTIKYCLYCNALFEKLNRKARKYCNHKCQRAYEKKIRFEGYLKGEVKISHSILRKYLVELHGAKCMDCGWDKINSHSGKCPIELEHIDGNSQNNKLENLKLLCPNCHSLTATYKALNIGKGRHKRRLRYQEGKSY